MSSLPLSPENEKLHFDLVIVGCGIVGLSHAYHAVRQGLTVAIVDHASHNVGSSVQNFGHVCITAQSGPALEYARQGRSHWLQLSRDAGFWARESGTHCVLRSDLEMSVAQEFLSHVGPGEAQILSREETLSRVPVNPSSVLGSLFLPQDLHIDPREAPPQIVHWLQQQGVQFYWRTAAHDISTGVVVTSRGNLYGAHIIVAVNHDIDRLFPDLAERDGLHRCTLHMLRVSGDTAFPLATPLFTGWSLARYSRFAALPSSGQLVRELAHLYPDAASHDLHLMMTPQRDGSILLGDTHHTDISHSPFQPESGFRLLIEHACELLGIPTLHVMERWQGVYCTGQKGEYLLEEPLPGVHVCVVATGIGMTTALGVAESIIADITKTMPTPHPASGLRSENFLQLPAHH